VPGQIGSSLPALDHAVPVSDGTERQVRSRNERAPYPVHAWTHRRHPRTANPDSARRPRHAGIDRWIVFAAVAANHRCVPALRPALADHRARARVLTRRAQTAGAKRRPIVAVTPAALGDLLSVVEMLVSRRLGFPDRACVDQLQIRWRLTRLDQLLVETSDRLESAVQDGLRYVLFRNCKLD